MIFIKYYSSSVPNQNRTLKNSVDFNYLIERLNDKRLIKDVKKFEFLKELFLWDVGKRATANIEIGAGLAIICGNNIYLGKIVGIIDDIQGKIGDVVGWARQFKQPWSNVIILKDVHSYLNEISDDILKLLKENDFYPTKLSNNFYKFDKDLEKKFLSKLDNKSNFEVSNQKDLIIEKKENIVLPDWLKNLVDDIKILKKDVNHQERGHESLIEHFFEKLGYERYNDIKFQRGRIDILISINEVPIITIEVKKYWNLNVKKDHEVIKQAYNYSHMIGSKYVIITNGEYFALFDRDKGRTYMDNLIAEFNLSNLTKSDLELVNLLKRDVLKSSLN